MFGWFGIKAAALAVGAAVTAVAVGDEGRVGSALSMFLVGKQSVYILCRWKTWERLARQYEGPLTAL